MSPGPRRSDGARGSPRQARLGKIKIGLGKGGLCSGKGAGAGRRQRHGAGAVTTGPFLPQKRTDWGARFCVGRCLQGLQPGSIASSRHPHKYMYNTMLAPFCPPPPPSRRFTTQGCYNLVFYHAGAGLWEDPDDLAAVDTLTQNRESGPPETGTRAAAWSRGALGLETAFPTGQRFDYHRSPAAGRQGGLLPALSRGIWLGSGGARPPLHRHCVDGEGGHCDSGSDR